ncbi:plac8 onzin related protein 6 [Trichomycterus rosablanca]|uniref:plac8 onzin related protein 6 n=1 Tax=Trichomycterus rosablanca TaxID=2290929 RepID=UPI002F35AF8A
MASTTVTVQPGVIIPAGAKTAQWSSGLCDCCEDMSICCFGLWCPCCMMCTTSQEFGECLCLPLLDYCCGAIIPPVTLSMRSSMRERYRLQGTMCDDCCVVRCCTLCAWCQMARELKFRRQPHVFVNPPVNITYQQQMQSPYQPPPMNPVYQAPMPSGPPAYNQHFKQDQHESAALYPSVQ